MDKGQRHHSPELPPHRQILELETVALDPVLSGFVGVILELSEHEDTFTLHEFSVGTGNQILKVTSSNEDFIRAFFSSELDAFNGLAEFYASPGTHNVRSTATNTYAYPNNPKGNRYDR